MHPFSVVFFIFMFLHMGFVGATVFFGIISILRYTVERMQGRQRYAVSWRLVKLWLIAIPLLAAVLMAWHLLSPRHSRTYTSPDGAHRLRLAVYNTLDIDLVRFKATLEDLESGKEPGEISELVRELFVQGWPDSEWADSIISVEWRQGQEVVRVIVTDRGTAYDLPSGDIVSPVPYEPELGKELP